MQLHAARTLIWLIKERKHRHTSLNIKSLENNTLWRFNISYWCLTPLIFWCHAGCGNNKNGADYAKKHFPLSERK